MDKRYKQISLADQIALREQAIQEVLANPQWSLAQGVSRVRAILRLTVPEMARLAKVSSRTLQDVEAGRSEGTVSTLNSLLGVLGLRLGVQRVTAQPMTTGARLLASAASAVQPPAAPVKPVSVRPEVYASDSVRAAAPKKRDAVGTAPARVLALQRDNPCGPAPVKSQVPAAPRVSSNELLSRGRPQTQSTDGHRASLAELRTQTGAANWLLGKTPQPKK